MDIGWLQDFLVLAETGNFTRAAQQRNISQAAFSRRIQTLETWVGVLLVDRRKHPISLTPEGVRFREETSELLGRILDMRSAVSDPAIGARAHVRIALPHALAVSRFPHWWAKWSVGASMSASLSIANISEIVPVFLSGGVDVMICHQGDQLPMVPDPEQFEYRVIETDRLQPYAARPRGGKAPSLFPGNENSPVPLLAYSRGTYFARLVDLVIEQAPQKLWSVRTVNASMAGVLLECIAAGLGVGWLPESIVSPHHARQITPVTTQGWSMNLRIVAYAHRKNRTPAANLLWDRIAA